MADRTALFKTQSNAIAAFLKLSGYKLEEISWSGDTCFWCFPDSASLRDEVSRYNRGEATVEPKRYNSMFMETRSEMFASDPRTQEQRNAARASRARHHSDR